jgi:sec-independent protein translocase protein TatC
MIETVSSKKKSKSPESVEMSFWEHLDSLRGHLFRSAIVFFIFSILAFLNSEFIFDKIILAPKESSFITYRLLCQLGTLLNIPSLCLGNLNIDIINLNLSGQFTTHVTTSFFAGIIFSAPYIIWEIWNFIKPALYEKEKSHSKGAVLALSILFIIGILFSYYIIVPLTLNFFGTYQVSGSVDNQISLTSYISTVVSVTLSLGIVFELPVFIFFLTKVGLITPAFLQRNRKYMIVVILIISAIITPPDIISQVLVSIPLFALYELSILVSKRIAR